MSEPQDRMKATLARKGKRKMNNLFEPKIPDIILNQKDPKRKGKGRGEE